MMNITKIKNKPFFRTGLFFLIGLAVGSAGAYFYQYRMSKPSTRLPFYAPRKNITRQTLLYAVSGNGLEQESYLQGILHVEHKDYEFSPQVKKATEKTDLLVTEIDFKVQKAFLRSAKESFLKIKSEYGLKPKHIEMLFSYMGKGKSLGLAAPSLTISGKGKIQSPEEWLYKLFQGQGKRTQALETIEEQMGFSSIEDPDSRALVTVFTYVSNMTKFFASLEKDEKEREYGEKIWHMYRTGEPLPKEFQKRWNSEIRGIYTKFLARRNTLWLPRMQKIMEQQPTYFAVGRWHFFGPKGLLKLLLEAGYRVEKIEEDGSRSTVTKYNYDAPFLAD